MMVDAAGYDKDGVLLTISQKCFALPLLKAAISTTGVGISAELLHIELQRTFASFDELIDGIEAFAPLFYEKHFELFEHLTATEINLSIIGWSERKPGPAAYSIKMHEDADESFIGRRTEGQVAEYGADAVVQADVFSLTELDGCTIVPTPYKSFAECGLAFDGEPDEIPENMDPELDLLHLLETQRRRKFATRPGCQEAHKVGGLALLTSVTEHAITQKVVHRWTEDKIGELIHPLPINDWHAWRVARVAANAVGAGVSPLRREMLERKARKHARKFR